MGQLLVRNLDDDLIRRLKERAAAHGHSAEAQHRAILERALRHGGRSFAERAALLEQERLGAPSLWLSEAANALWAKAMRGELTTDEAQGQATDLADAPIVSIGLPGLLPTAMKLALELRHPIYACFYLTAALQRNTHVVTADRRLSEQAGAHPSFAGRVRLLVG